MPTKTEKLLEKLLKNPKILALLEEEDEAEKNTYRCSHCDHTLSSDKRKRKCPKCKRFGLVQEIQEQEEVEVDEASDEEQEETHIFNPKSARKEEIEEGTPCRREKVTGIKTKFVDPGGFEDDTELFDKKVKFQVGQRRKPFKPINRKCSKCEKTFKINPVLDRKDWRCDKCIRPGTR